MKKEELGILKVGDKIIDFGWVYRIFKISSQKTTTGRKRIIYFRPYFKKGGNQGLVCTVPEDNLSETNIRRPTGKKEIGILLRRIPNLIRSAEEISPGRIQQAISDSDLTEMIKLLKYLYYNRKSEGKDFTVSQKRTFNSLANRVAEEAALVLDKKPEQIKEKIDRYLKKGLGNIVKTSEKK